jgi:hypothetical protein
VTIQIPGAFARLAGTYSLLSSNVDLHGTAHLDTKLSDTQKGIKSVLLKVVDPLFKSRRNKGAEVPIKLTGRYGHTSLHMDVKKKL